MPTPLDGGCVDTAREDPTAIAPNQLQEATGVEYRRGSSAIWTARGREQRWDTGSGTLLGTYHAGFDTGSEVILAQDSGTFYAGQIAATMTTGATFSSGSAGLPAVGVHYGGRHYLVTGTSNHVVEGSGLAVTARKMGMIEATAAIATSVTQGAGSMTTTTGMEYWVTEYDSNRGIESLAGGTASSGSFTSKDGVVLTITGTSLNTNTTHWRIYRSVDGGVFPTGGLLVQIAVGTTTHTDTDTNTSSAILPAYGNVQINGLDFDRDEMPPVFTALGGPFEDSLLAFEPDSREVRYTPAGFPESWPSIFAIPLQTRRQDIGVGFAVLRGAVGVFTRDTVHRITRLPRDVDAAFAAGEAVSLISDERGAISRRGITTFTMPGRTALIAFVSRDGIWATNLETLIPLTDLVDWEGRVSVADLASSWLINDPTERRLVFGYKKVGDSHATGVMYLDYITESVRVTHPNHGPLAGAALAPYNGLLRLFTADSRAGDGRVYSEATGDADASQLGGTDAVSWAIRTAEIFPAGVQADVAMDVATWMHGAGGPTNTLHEFYQDRISTPYQRRISLSERQATDVGLTRSVNSFSLRLSGSGTTSFPINWLDIDGNEAKPLGGEGA